MSHPDENPFSLAPSEKQIQDFANRRKPDPPELGEFRRMYDSLLPQAEADGFGNVFSWIANRQATQQRTDQHRDDESRIQSEFAKTVGVLPPPTKNNGPNENVWQVRSGGGFGGPTLRSSPVRQGLPRPITSSNRNAPNTPSEQPAPPQQMVAPPGYRLPNIPLGRIVPNLDDNPFVRPLDLPDHDDIPRDPTLPPMTLNPAEIIPQIHESFFRPISLAATAYNKSGRPGSEDTRRGTEILEEECEDIVGKFYPDLQFSKRREAWFRAVTPDGLKQLKGLRGSSYADTRMAIRFNNEPEKGINVNTATVKKDGYMILREHQSFQRLKHNLRAAGNEVADWFKKYHKSYTNEAAYRRDAREKCLEIMEKFVGPPQQDALPQ